MIISHHGVLQLLVTSCVLAIAFCAQNVTDSENNEASDSSFKNGTEEQTAVLQTTETDSKTGVTKVVKSRRAPRFDSAGSNSWVRIYNRPPGTKESFYNYDTRSNTSAHTSGEAWESFKDKGSVEITSPIKRSDGKIKDILRVKPKQKETVRVADVSKSKPAIQTTLPPIKSTLSPLKSTPLPIKQQPPANDNQKKGFIIWSSSDGGSNSGWTLDDKPSTETEMPQPSLEKMIPRDGSQWKVVGEGGEDGWEVIDDKGKVEWKIEYDDGEWRVTSTGDIPADAEWIDPEYIWGPTDGSVSDDQYNAWPADDYKIPPRWIDPEVLLRGLTNGSKPINDYDYQGNEEDVHQSAKPEWKIEEPSTSPPLNTKEKFRFGTRRKFPTNEPTTTASTERIVDSENSEEKSDVLFAEDKPQSDEGGTDARSWIPGADRIRGGQKWVQGYGSKTWEGDNSGWNAQVGGETWVATNKNYDPWVPKIPGADDISQKPPADDTNTSKQDNSIRAWGTGYGSKTWKGAEWDSNVVWKTGFNGGLPWAADNSTWKFPDDNEDKKKPEIWSQPIPNIEEISVASKKTANPPSKNLSGVRIKWPAKPINTHNAVRKQPPSRRTEGESWSDDTKLGGVVWQQKSDVSTTLGPVTPKPNIREGGWKIGGWKISTSSEEEKPVANPWKNNAQPKDDLISVPWQVEGDIPIDSVPFIWNQEQWPDYNDGPTWIFGGCKMSLKCGSKDNDDNSNQSNVPDKDNSLISTTTPPAPTMSVGKGWPARPKGGKSWKPPTKSWKPPTKSWKPPKWMQSTPPPPPETMNPIITLKPSPPTPKWKKPAPPPGMWKQPPPTIIWPETTPAPAPPSISWKPPPPQPPMKWKKGPRPTKSWKPPPTKSWKPPVPPSKTWQPSIATPPPDMWPSTKPDCKDATEVTQPSHQPNPEDDSDMMEPPQIIIITKLPKSPVPSPDEKKDKGNSKGKPQFGPWMFPPRKNVPKGSKNRKDKNINMPVSNSVKNRPNRPGKNNAKQPNIFKGWPKGMPPPNFVWPSNSMRRWTTKRPQTPSTWKYTKYSKPKTWRQMLRKWMNGR